MIWKAIHSNVPAKQTTYFLLDLLISRREDSLEQIVNNLRDSLSNFFELFKDKCKQTECRYMVYGSIMDSLSKQGLLPLIYQHVKWHGSIKRLRYRLKRLQYITLKALDPNHSCKLLDDKRWSRFTGKVYLLLDLDGEKRCATPQLTWDTGSEWRCTGSISESRSWKDGYS